MGAVAWRICKKWNDARIIMVQKSAKNEINGVGCISMISSFASYWAIYGGRGVNKRNFLIYHELYRYEQMKQNIQMGRTDSQGIKYLKINSSDDRKII